jgi:hypothetical protein
MTGLNSNNFASRIVRSGGASGLKGERDGFPIDGLPHHSEPERGSGETGFDRESGLACS